MAPGDQRTPTEREGIPEKPVHRVFASVCSCARAFLLTVACVWMRLSGFIVELTPKSNRASFWPASSVGTPSSPRP